MDIVRIIDHIDSNLEFSNNINQVIEIRDLSELIDFNNIDFCQPISILGFQCNDNFILTEELINTDNNLLEKEIEELDLYFTQFIELSKKEQEYKRILEDYESETHNKKSPIDKFDIISRVKEIGLSKIISSGLVLAGTTLTILNIPTGIFIGTKIALGTSGVGLLGYMYLKK
jgi:hypothetical protein